MKKEMDEEKGGEQGVLAPGCQGQTLGTKQGVCSAPAQLTHSAVLTHRTSEHPKVAQDQDSQRVSLSEFPQ